LNGVRAARGDLLAIIDYISDDNPDAAQRLKDEIEAKVARLAKHPKRFREGRVAGTREMLCDRITSSYTPKMPKL
jgi:plasmid stabilization system protein ParE